MIQSLFEKLNDTTSIETVFNYEVDLPIDDDLKLNIYRIAQEQINNIIKYAEASFIHINVESDDNLLRVEIKDNGKGFDMEKKRRGIGITNMINRIESFNGKLRIITSAGNGCTISIEVPV